MNISKLNPIGYEATTPKGNKYKKSKFWTTMGIGELAFVLAAEKSKNPYIKVFSLKSQVESICDTFSMIGKTIPQKAKTPMMAGFAALIVASGYLSDVMLNKFRAKKADKEAEKTMKS
jgi:hypothetical protein